MDQQTIDALLAIAKSIHELALAVGSLGTVGWLFLLFKDMNGNSGNEKIANAIIKLSEKIDGDK